MIPGGEAPPPKKIFLHQSERIILIFMIPYEKFFLHQSERIIYTFMIPGGEAPPSEKNFFWRQSERIIYLYDSLRKNFFGTSQKE